MIVFKLMDVNEMYLNSCNRGPRTKRNIYILCFYWYATHKEGVIRSMLLLVSDHFWRISPCPDFLAPCKIGKIDRMNYPINRIKSKWPSNYYLTLPCHYPKSRPVGRSPWIYSSKDFLKRNFFLISKKMDDLFCQEWTFHIWLKRRSCSPPDTSHCICNIECWILSEHGWKFLLLLTCLHLLHQALTTLSTAVVS